MMFRKLMKYTLFAILQIIILTILVSATSAESSKYKF